MHISEKINFKIYTSLSILLLIFAYFLSLNTAEYKVLVMVFLAACINHYMLVRAVGMLTRSAIPDNQEDTTLLIPFLIGKAIVLIVALIFGVQIMGKRIIIPVLIYVLQIGVLYLSLKGSSEEQGSK